MIVKILKGCHFSLKFPKIFRVSKDFKLKYSITFTNSCSYTINEDSCVNKLFGITNGLFNVHRNSERFGWSYEPITRVILIWRYSYNNKILSKKEIYRLNIGESLRLELRIVEKNGGYNVIYMINNLIKSTQKTSTIPRFLFYELTPYFGGKSKAPHIIDIEMNEL